MIRKCVICGKVLTYKDKYGITCNECHKEQQKTLDPFYNADYVRILNEGARREDE